MTDSHLTELERLAALRRDGALTEEEFQLEKARLLNDGLPPVRPAHATPAAPVRRRRGGFFGFLLGLFFIALILIAIWLFIKNRDIDQAAAPAPQTPTSAVTVTTLPPEQQMQKATEAAFGTPPQMTIKGAESVTYTAKHLVPAPFGPILVSEGVVDNAGHASAGKIAVHYLKPEADRYSVVKSFVPALESGSFGQVTETTIRPDFAANPTLQTEGGGTWQGYTCSWITLTELTANGPVHRATVPLSYSNGGAVETNPVTIEGTITQVVANQSFDVTYTGARGFTDHYVRDGETYVIRGPASRMETC